MSLVGSRVAVKVRPLVTLVVAPRQSLTALAAVRMADASRAVLKVELFNALDNLTAGACFVFGILLDHGLNLSRGGGDEDVAETVTAVCSQRP